VCVRRELSFEYAPRAASVANTGHGVQVNFAAESALRARVGGRTLQLLQFHFHTPSEHALDGNRHARGRAVARTRLPDFAFNHRA
jgi:carbonic anhydrase